MVELAGFRDSSGEGFEVFEDCLDGTSFEKSDDEGAAEALT
jgi:hypothetical protein